jgi:hypothetical protein
MVITDAGLAYVGQMKGLKELTLSGLPRITDAGIDHLRGLSDLEYLVIHGVSITPDGLQRLYAALPDCRMITSPVICPGPQNVRKIVVRKLTQPESPSVEISDVTRIADIVNLIEGISAGSLSDARDDGPWPASFELSLMGKSRQLYQARIGGGALQWNYHTRWNKWIIDKLDEEKLLQLISTPRDK